MKNRFKKDSINRMSINMLHKKDRSINVRSFGNDNFNKEKAS